MAHSTQKRAHPDKAMIPPTVMLALWRVRQTWGLLLLTSIGVVCSVMFVCAVPLYSDVAMTAELRGAIRSAPENADIYVQGFSDQVSAPVINTLSKRIDQKFQKQFGSYIGVQQLSMITPEFTVLNRENSISF